jgi:hypothetical protein
MTAFATQRDAKEFLVGEIVREAERENQPLSEIERKMLYFSETDWTLPDMPEVAESFDREYDTAKYERRIARLADAARKHVDRSRWSAAVERLSEGDHYLLVMVGIAGRPDAMTWKGAVAVLLVLGLTVAGRLAFGGSTLLWTAIALPALVFASRIGTRRPKHV